MADVLQTRGKYYGMLGIRNEITTVRIMTAAAANIATATVVGTTDFTVSAVTGTITNDGAITFTIGAEDVGNTASIVAFEDGTGELMRLDLDTAKLLDSEGTASFAAGEISATL